MTVIDEAVRKTIGAVETIAPQAWRLAVQYERVDAVAGIAVCCCWLAAFTMALGLMWKASSKNGVIDEEDRAPARLISGILYAIAVLIVCSIAACDIGQYAAAEAYAAKRIVAEAGCK